MPPTGCIRIGLDAGDVFTHAVGVRAQDGAVLRACVPSTPDEPSRASGLAIRGILEQAQLPPSELAVLVFTTTAMRNALTAHQPVRTALIVNKGFSQLLEVGSFYTSEGTAPAIPRARLIEVAGRIAPGGNELEPLDEETIREAAARIAAEEVEAVAVCLLHAGANGAHERRVRDILAEALRGHPVSLSCESLPDAPETERARAALLDAACKVLVGRAIAGAAGRAAKAMSAGTSFLVMKSDGGVTSARNVLERPLIAALGAGAASLSAGAAFARAAELRRAVVLDVGGASAWVGLVEEGTLPLARSQQLGEDTVGLPGVDLAAVPLGAATAAWATAEGMLRLDPLGAGGRLKPMSHPGGGNRPTLADAFLVLGRLPTTLAGGAVALDRERAAQGMRDLGEACGLAPDATALAVTEAAVARLADAVRELTAGRGKDPRDYTLIALGGTAPLLAAETAAELGIREILIPPHSAHAAAAGLIETDRRNHYTRVNAARVAPEEAEGLDAAFQELEEEAASELDAEGVPPESRLFLRAADLRYQGEAWEETIEFPPGPPFRAAIEGALAAFREAHRHRLGDSGKTPPPVESVRLRLTVSARLPHPPRSPAAKGRGGAAANVGEREAALREGETVLVPVHERGGLGAGDRLEGPALVEEECATAFIPPLASCKVDADDCLHVRLPDAPGAAALATDVAEGALRAAEREMEELLTRAARSSYMREMALCRAAVFDKRGRKLTGRAFSPAAAPLLEDFSPEEISEGDVFLWNDAFSYGGGTGRLAELCCCAPVFQQGELAAFVLTSGRHEDLGGTEPGSLSPTATQAFQEGLLIPPVKLYARGVLNEAALRIIARNSRRESDLRADIGAQVAAVRSGAARLAELFRHAKTGTTVQASFDELLARGERAADALIGEIPEGNHAFEDYVESDGVETHKVHALRLRMHRAGGRLILDFTGTAPQARGPVNWPGNRDGGALLKKWLGACLRHLRPVGERSAASGVNEGACAMLDTRFPPPGTLLTPAFPASTGMGFLTLQRLRSLFLGALGLATAGRMPADGEPASWWGLRGRNREGGFFLLLEVMGGGTGGRPGSDGEDATLGAPGWRSLPAEYLEHHFPLHVERVGLAPDSGGPGRHRGGLGLLRELRVLCDCEIVSHAGRGFLAPWGANAGRAGGRFRILINPGTPVEREVPALSAGVRLTEGDRVRIETPGGGGWGDPLERETERVHADLEAGRLSVDSAMRHYGVVFTAEEPPRLDRQGTQALRAFMRDKRGRPPFFDRGPNFQAVRESG